MTNCRRRIPSSIRNATSSPRYSKVCYQPASKAGGDYYDFVQIDEDHLGILVSDVSGHGCPAAVIMAMMRVLLRSVFCQVISPKEALEKINLILCDNIESGHFITAFYGVIHLPTRRMKFASAGHNPPLLIDYDQDKVHQLTTTKGFPLIIFPQNDLEENEIELPLNSKLVLYTDGLTEAHNPQGEMFGLDRFSDHLQELGKSMDAVELGIRIKEMAQEFISSTSFSEDESLTDLNKLVQGFVHDTVFTDDYTLVILEVLP
jgi:sigma-B regulation protein RsbU (phosphoserine phosphatase)